MLFVDNIQRHIYMGCKGVQLSWWPLPLLPAVPFPLHLLTPLFTYLENQLLLLMVRIPIHSCPWFAINCSPLPASPTPRHPTIKLHIYIDDINHISCPVWYRDNDDFWRVPVWNKSILNNVIFFYRRTLFIKVVKIFKHMIYLKKC